MGCEVRDVKEYVTGLRVSPVRRCSLLEGLRINSQFFRPFGTSGQGALEDSRLFSEADVFNIIGIQ